MGRGARGSPPAERSSAPPVTSAPEQAPVGTVDLWGVVRLPDAVASVSAGAVDHLLVELYGFARAHGSPELLTAIADRATGLGLDVGLPPAPATTADPKPLKLSALRPTEG